MGKYLSIPTLTKIFFYFENKGFSSVVPEVNGLKSECIVFTVETQIFSVFEMCFEGTEIILSYFKISHTFCNYFNTAVFDIISRKITSEVLERLKISPI